MNKANCESIESENVKRISYSVKIHDMKTCHCKRITCNKVKSLHGEVCLLALEKIHDKEKLLYITGYPCRDSPASNSESILCNLFHDRLAVRQKVSEYFRKYEWSESESCEMRKILRGLPSICYCQCVTITSPLTSNAGFVIVGNKQQMKTISHCFNKFVTPDEFTAVSIVKISNIKLIKEEARSFNITRLLESPVFAKLNQEAYTILGTDFEKKNMFSLPFGKREWYPNNPETSYECAKRELYEECNIQFSKKLLEFSKSLDKDQYIASAGFILYFVYLPSSTEIFYHNESETIYIK